jgi:hypothetical protein
MAGLLDDSAPVTLQKLQSHFSQEAAKMARQVQELERSVQDALVNTRAQLQTLCEAIESGGGGGGGVTSFETRVGAVVSASGDYTSTEVSNLSGVAGSTVTAALNALDGAVAPVTSVFGRTGAVNALGGDYNSSAITNISSVAGANVTNALDALLTDQQGTFVRLTMEDVLTTGPTVFAIEAIVDISDSADFVIVLAAGTVEIVKPGAYVVTFSGRTAHTGVLDPQNIDITFQQNGSNRARACATRYSADPTIEVGICGAYVVDCIAGDILTLLPSGSQTLPSTTSQRVLSIARVTTPTSLDQPTTAWSGFFDVQIAPNNATDLLLTVDFSSGGFTNGVDSITIPASGTYSCIGILRGLDPNVGLGRTGTINFERNGTVVGSFAGAREDVTEENVSAGGFLFTATAGDIITVKSGSGSGVDISTGTSSRRFGIHRIGA